MFDKILLMRFFFVQQGTKKLCRVLLIIEYNVHALTNTIHAHLSHTFNLSTSRAS